MLSDDADLDHREGLGALNFLVLDDLPIREEGQPVDEASVLELPLALDLPVFPEFLPIVDDPFLQKVQASGRKWVILVDSEATPRLVLDADAFLRETLFLAGTPDPYSFCHRPLVTTRPDEPLGAVIRRLQVEPDSKEDDVIDRDLILLWGEQRRIVTGADLLGRLMRGIVRRRAGPAPRQARIRPGATPA
jgi:hypothetical protein